MAFIAALVSIMMLFTGLFTPANAEDVGANEVPVVKYEARLMNLKEISAHANEIYRPTVYVEVTFDEHGECSLNVFLDDGDNDPSNEYRVNHVVLEPDQWAIVDGQIFVNGEVLYKVAEHAGNI